MPPFGSGTATALPLPHPLLFRLPLPLPPPLRQPVAAPPPIAPHTTPSSAATHAKRSRPRLISLSTNYIRGIQASAPTARVCGWGIQSVWAGQCRCVRRKQMFGWFRRGKKRFRWGGYVWYVSNVWGFFGGWVKEKDRGRGRNTCNIRILATHKRDQQKSNAKGCHALLY